MTGIRRSSTNALITSSTERSFYRAAWNADAV